MRRRNLRQRTLQNAKQMAENDFNLTLNDVKDGTKLELFKKLNEPRDVRAAKLDYYKKLKPNNGQFKQAPMDPNQ